MDKEKSIWRPVAFDKNEPRTIDKLVLDTLRLDAVPLQERLIFDLKEHRSYHLFHETVVDAITKINPTGLQFISVYAWHKNIGFELI
jgi:hypothetical protein